MNYCSTGAARVVAAIIVGWAIWCANEAFAQSAPVVDVADEVRIVEIQGVVEISPHGATTWVRTQANQLLHPFDHVRTGANSRAALRWSKQSVLSFGASTELEILPPHRPDEEPGLSLVRGIISFFHRDRPGRMQVITRGAMAGVEGTEFVLSAVEENSNDRTTVSVIDGNVRFGNNRATLLLTNGQQAVVEAGHEPARTPGFQAKNILQWCFYYPAVLDLTDLPWSAQERNVLAESFTAYNAGNLVEALAKYPSARQLDSNNQDVYYAALLLSVGQVQSAQMALSSIKAHNTCEAVLQTAAALEELIAAVKCQPSVSTNTPRLATEYLASSYYEQSRAVRGTSIETALRMAKLAAVASPRFGFAWERVAELEFSFGRTKEAMQALEKSLALTPQNAQALALKGFLLAAQDKTSQAIDWFNRALAQDSALGNAWLGRGLNRIRKGDTIGGREDLLVAAALEPQRAQLRSYLGKSYAQSGDVSHAYKELQLAKSADPNDPTAWLYSALLNQKNNRINQAIRDLETSQQANDNRTVYRSQLLLDQDRAMRGANLAALYRDAGMFDVSLREAARAANYDYANYSAHLFLANSYAEIRNQNLIALRYETPSQAEYLVANLLAPVGAGAFSPTISQQEYSKLFQQNGFGVISDTEYLSRGAWKQTGAQYGTFDRINYDIEAAYLSDPGQRLNNDLQMRQLSVTTKMQLTTEDAFLLSVTHYTAQSGDLLQYYSTNMANSSVRIDELQEPLAAIGYHHEWGPGMHTLLFATRLDDTLSFTNPAAPTLVTFRPDVNPTTLPGITKLTGVQQITMHEKFRGNLEIYSGELQQIWQLPAHNTIIGSRIQYGHFDNDNLQALPDALASVFPNPPTPAAKQHAESLFRRLSFYGYHQWQIVDPLQLIGGLTYENLVFPENFRDAPISIKNSSADGVFPKAGLIWTPGYGTTVRLAYTRSLAGASLDQSFQLEPSQVAGFVQSFRSIIPESLVGANAGAKFETYGISFEQKFNTGTYLGISAELLNSQVHRTVGAFDVLPDELDFASVSSLREHLDYRERSLLVTANQLIGQNWSVGTRYRLSQASLSDNFIDVADNLIFVDFKPKQHLEGLLQQLGLFLIYNHPCGLFAQEEAQFYAQNNDGYSPSEPVKSFWQLNAFVGYRFYQRRAQLTFGLLNATDQDYQLNPINLYSEIPRNRTMVIRLQLNL